MIAHACPRLVPSFAALRCLLRGTSPSLSSREMTGRKQEDGGLKRLIAAAGHSFGRLMRKEGEGDLQGQEPLRMAPLRPSTLSFVRLSGRPPSPCGDYVARLIDNILIGSLISSTGHRWQQRRHLRPQTTRRRARKTTSLAGGEKRRFRSVERDRRRWQPPRLRSAALGRLVWPRQIRPRATASRRKKSEQDKNEAIRDLRPALLEGQHRDTYESELAATAAAAPSHKYRRPQTDMRI